MAHKASPEPPPTTSDYRVAGPDLKGLALLLLSLVTLLALLGIGPGRLNEVVANALRWLVGWGAYPCALLVGVVGVLVLRRYEWRGVRWGRVLAAELLALCLLALSTLLANPSLSWVAAGQGSGGGVTGWALASLFSPLGTWGSIVLFLLCGLLLLPPLFSIPLDHLQERVEQQRQTMEQQRSRLLAAPPALPPSTPPVRPVHPAQSVAAPKVDLSRRTDSAPRAAMSHPPVSPQEPTKSASESNPLLGRFKEVVSKATEKATSPSAKGQGMVGMPPPLAKKSAAPRYDLPPLDLLQRSSSNRIDPNVAREKARIIEETLRQFGVPATVVQVNQGPAVTQFGVQPGFIEVARRDGSLDRRKVKVNAITSLADDLALALAAKSIRVEAPVPGRPYVGIEVPNSDTEMVTLHSVLTSEEFKKLDSDLGVALGRNVSGQPVVADLGRMPHALIAGATGSGKSVCVNTIIASLLLNLGPDDLKLLMIDPKMVELIPYNGIPHLIAPVVTDMERVVGALTWAMREMDRRYKLFSEVGKRNHESYNQWAAPNGRERLPYIVIIIDELADLMMVAADQVERIICRLAQMARATGIHLLLATQRPSVDVVTGLIKANVPTRISFAVASGIDSRVILDSVGAEALLGRGDMLYQAPDSGKLQRLQGCFVSDQELQAIVNHWLRATPQQSSPATLDKTPWDEIMEESAASSEEGSSDDLLEQAIAIVREHQWASTSFLQRKLRIGYTRAARLIDTLEERGIIGPPEDGSNGSRTVLVEPADSKREVEP